MEKLEALKMVRDIKIEEYKEYLADYNDDIAEINKVAKLFNETNDEKYKEEHEDRKIILDELEFSLNELQTVIRNLNRNISMIEYLSK